MNKQEIQSFGDVFNGKTPSKEEQRSDGLPVLKIRDINENGQFRGVFESFVDPLFYKKHFKKKLKAGDTIILNAAHNRDYVGSKTAFIPPVLNGVIATGEWLIVRAKEADAAYVNQFLKSPMGKRSLKKCVKGIHLYPKDVERIKIPLPPPNDQIRIAHLLGKVEGMIAQRKQHLLQLDELLKSIFLEMFGDPINNPKEFPVRKLSEFYINPKEGTKCGPFGSALKKDELVESGVPVWNMDNIDLSGQMVLPFRMWITEEKYQELRPYSVADGDIIISRAGTVGKMCVAKMNGIPAIISTNLIRLRLDQELLPLHVVSLMTYCKGRVGRLKTGPDGAFTHMNTGVLDNLVFPYPPIELQNQFTTLVEQVERIKIHYKESLTELENLYGALSQMAFKGDLDLSRVPLKPITASLDVQLDDVTLVASGTVKDQQQFIDLPDVENMLEALATNEGREALIRVWLSSYLKQTEELLIVNLKLGEFLANPTSTEEENYDQLAQWLRAYFAQEKSISINRFIAAIQGQLNDLQQSSALTWSKEEFGKLRQWREACIEPLRSEILIRKFIELCRCRFEDLQNNEALRWSVASYEHIKNSLFKAIEEGEFTQSYDDEGNCLYLLTNSEYEAATP